MTIGDILVLEYNNRIAFYVVDEKKVRYYTTVEDFCSFLMKPHAWTYRARTVHFRFLYLEQNRESLEKSFEKMWNGNILIDKVPQYFDKLWNLKSSTPGLLLGC